MKVVDGNLWDSDRRNISVPRSDIILNLRYISTISSDITELSEILLKRVKT